MTAGRRVLLLVAATALLVQALSARFLVRDFETPNVSTRIAHGLADTGEFTIPGWPDHPRAYVLPVEPLLLAAAFRTLPPSMWRYVHVPVTALLITAIAAVALMLFGPGVAVVAAALALFDPFIVAHGPVWDDAFLAAALEWVILAVLVHGIMRQALNGRGESRRAWSPLVCVAAGIAALTRSEAQWLLALVGVCVWSLPRFRSIRSLGRAIVLGVVVALAAWGARNAVVLGQFVVGTSHDGKTLFESNYGTALAAIRRAGVAQVFIPGHIPEPMVRAADQGEIEGDRALARAAVAYMAAHPIHTLETSLFKTVVSLLGWNVSLPPAAPRNVALIATNAFLLMLAAVGWRRMPMRTAGSSVWRLWASCSVLVVVLVLALGPVGLRYRISLNGLVAISAAIALRGRTVRG